VSDRVAVAATVAEGTAVALVVGAGVADAGADVALGAGAPPLGLAHAFVSADSTVRQTLRAVGSQAVPSAAVREIAIRMNG
jgi:imidazole glycerol phosphate synthase subunit HisF